MTLIGSQIRFPTHWQSPTAPIDWTMGWDMQQRLTFDSSKHRQLPTNKKNVAISQAYHTNLQTWRSWLPRWKTLNIVSWGSKWTPQTGIYPKRKFIKTLQSKKRIGIQGWEWGGGTQLLGVKVCWVSLISSEKRSIWGTYILLKTVARIPRNHLKSPVQVVGLPKRATVSRVAPMKFSCPTFHNTKHPPVARDSWGL